MKPSFFRYVRKLRFRNWNFGNRLVVMVLFFTLAPLIVYATFSLRLFRQSIINSGEMQLSQIAKSLIMLCEAQEALDRLKKGAAAPARLDAMTRASPSWIDGNEYKSLQSIIQGMGVARSGFAYVFNSAGLLVVHPTNAGANIFDAKLGPHADFMRQIRGKALGLRVGEIRTIRYAYSDPTAPSSPRRTRLEAYGYFKPYDWIVAVGCDEDELIGAYFEGRRVFFLMMAAAAAAAGILVFLFSRRMMRPIVRLTEAASQIAQGRYPSVKPLGTRDEIGKLTGEFNTMVNRLHEEQIRELMDGTKELEKKVEERTADLQKAYAQLMTIEKLASLGKISAMVAHELNNPMSGILSYSVYCEKISQGDGISAANAKELRECLNMISREAERCGQIVNNLLLFAKHSYGDFTQASVQQIVERGAMVIDHSLKVNEIALEKKFDCRDDVIWCDPSGLEQMFIALTINAVEAMDRGGKILVETDCAADDVVRIQISDTGHGIPAELLPHIFEPFVTAKNSKSSVGLGLSVVYGIVQSHGGTIAVESTVGAGSIFRIALPRRPRQSGRVAENSAPAATEKGE
jgi:signal transduction histidine kinase